MIEERNDKSLCEKSMKMVVNIIKLSSFSIAKMSLGTSGTEHPSSPTKSLTPATDSDMVTDQLLQQSSSKPYSYVVQPEGGNESMMVHQEKRDGDGIFAAYIRKVHEKNRSNFHEASKLSPYILPPPPTPLTRKK
ncbi:hypothetical protein PTKIN_Ptkin04bG0079300 [Pterospermum kingtungense]